MDIASVAALVSAGVGTVTLGTLVFQTGRFTAKFTAKLDSMERSVMDLTDEFRDHVHEHNEKHTTVVERLSSLEASRNGDGR